MYDYNPYSRTTVELWLYNYSTYSRTTVELWSYNYRSFSRTTKESLQKPFTNNYITSCLSRYCVFLSYFQYSQQNKSRMKIRESQLGICQKNYSHIPINTLVKLRTIHYLKEIKKGMPRQVTSPYENQILI